MSDKPHPGSEITCQIDGDCIVLKFPADLLVWSQEHRENGGLVIKNKKAMMSYLKNRILYSRTDTETASTAVERMIDDCFDEAYEDGENWLEEYRE